MKGHAMKSEHHVDVRVDMGVEYDCRYEKTCVYLPRAPLSLSAPVFVGLVLHFCESHDEVSTCAVVDKVIRMCARRTFFDLLAQFGIGRLSLG